MTNITILGGGSAGWMTAKYLSVKNPNLNITLIESPNIKPIGVGESMTPYLMRFFESIGIKNESDWMPHCNATYKNGVLYQDWDYKGSRFWHAFEVDEGIYPYWNIKREKEGLTIEDYWKSTMCTGRMGIEDSNKWLSDKDGNTPNYYHSQVFNGWPQTWAYHIDAGEFGEFIKEITLDDINYVRTDIVDVETDKNGITKIIDDRGEEFVADLYIDCTGFKKKLIKEVNDKFNTFGSHLTHDKAIVMQIPYKDKEAEMKPRTKATALSSGWAWEIPLYNRIGNGYVYSSKYITDEEAEKEFREYLGLDRVDGVKSFIVDIETGYYDKPFTKNVVAVGLSSGFIEPLEATSLFLSQLSGIRIDDVINGRTSIEKYNEEFETNIKDFLDFISIGYYLSGRNDSDFWKDQNDSCITDKMQEWISSCKYKMQPPSKKELFVNSSWISKLIGFNVFPETSMFDEYNKEEDENAEKFMSEMKSFDLNTKLTQKEYLDKFIYKV